MSRVLRILILFMLTSGTLSSQENFVQVKNATFYFDGTPYHFIGANMWFGIYLAADGETGNRERLIEELDALQELGVDNLRIMVASEGPDTASYRIRPSLQYAPNRYNKDLFRGIDFLLNELRRRNMKAVLCLNNFFHWTGGMAQYVNWSTGKPIPYPHDPPYDWSTFQEFSADFFGDEQAKKWYRKFLRKIIRRKNTINGIPYRKDPTIMAWQLANEPRGFSKVEDYKNWVASTTNYIHRLDKNHLISLGGEGFLPFENIGTAFGELSTLEHVDYLTVHMWIENWQWYDPKKPATYDTAVTRALSYLDRHLPVAKTVGKPIVLEEFGISRDNGDHHPDSNTVFRDRYFTTIFEYVYDMASSGQGISGANFWSWSGRGIPERPHEMWKAGDPLTGDPPHELQGWYSIYSHDYSTLAIIKKYAELMKNRVEVKEP